MVTAGYGETSRGVTSSTCKYESLETGLILRGCVNDPFDFNTGLGTYLSNLPEEIINVGVHSTPGDSGGATLLLTDVENLADMPLVGINSLADRCIDTPNGTQCGAVSARIDDLKTWFSAIAGYE